MDKLNRPGALTIHKVLHGTDFLESSRLALDYAVGFAVHFSASLTITHAFEPTQEAVEAEFRIHQPSASRADALARLERLGNGARRLGADVSIDLREGRPAKSIIQAALEVRADLLVLGTHGVYRGLEHLLIGSNAERLLLSAPCPTLTVGRHALAGVDATLTFQEIVLITDLKADSKTAAVYAFFLARHFGAPLNVYVLAEDTRKGSSEDAVAAFFRDLKQDQDPSQSCRYEIQSIGSPQDAIRRAENSPNSLAVTAVRPISHLDQHLHSSFAFELTARSSSPVLSVPPALSVGAS